MINTGMEFFKSRNFILALISTMLCLFIFYGYGIWRGKDQLIDDIMILGGLFAILNLSLFYLFHSNNRILKNLILSEDRLQYAMEANGEGIYDWDLKTNKVYYSKNFVEMLGYTQSEFGNDLEAFNQRLHADDYEMVHNQVDQFINDNLSEYSIEFRMLNREKHTIWVNSRANLIRSNAGEAIRVIGTHRDITAMKVKEENLIDTIEETARESESKSSFLAHMSHEIRTPLTAITGIAEILQKQSEGFNDKQKQLVKTLSTSSQSLKDLINDILDFSKIEKGDVEIDYNYFPISTMIAEVISIMSVQAQEKNIGFKVIDEDVKNFEYLGDKARIRQILINLIGNAIKFTSEGQVTLLIEKSSDNDIETLDFIIQDTGIGIDNDALHNIFEEFQQADKSVSRKYGGTGLGLPISKKLAHLMGGDIDVQSKKNMGSTFTLTLPMTDKYKEVLLQDDPTANIKITDRLSSEIRGEQCALIVDDYEGNVVILTYLMEEIGLQYDIANNGEEAIEKWKSKHYDLILMDVQMPVVDGLTATKNIRDYEAENNFDATPIIGMTAHALVEDKQKCIDAGMTDYLPKPIDSQKLKKTIYRHIYGDNKKLVTT